MFFRIFRRLFTTETAIRNTNLQRHRLHIESLENRELLSVAPSSALPELELGASAVVSDDRFEPNDSMSAVAQQVAGDLNSPNLGKITGTTVLDNLTLTKPTETQNRDFDWFRFELSTVGQAGNAVSVTTSGVGYINLSLFDGNGDYIEHEWGVWGNNSADTSISLEGLFPGVYYVRTYANTVEGVVEEVADYSLTIVTPDTSAPSSVTCNTFGDVLFIEGTNGADWVEIEETKTQIIVHTFSPNGQTELDSQSFAKGDINTLRFHGNDGDDTFKNSYAGAVGSIACYLEGGDGNDTLIGGNGNDRIFGGAGDDVLNGVAGNNLLAGGFGTNIFYTTEGGSSAYAWSGTDDQWATGDHTLGDYDAHLIFDVTDRAGNSEDDFYGNILPYVPWTDADVADVLNIVAGIYDYTGSYKYFQNTFFEDKIVYMVLTDNYAGLGSVAGYNSYNVDVLFRANAVNSRLTIHEFGHFWNYSDTDLPYYVVQGNPFYDAFCAISYNSDGTMKDDAVDEDFAFGIMNPIIDMPYEDWAYSISLVFAGFDSYVENPSALWYQKVAIINEFAEWLAAPTDTPTSFNAHDFQKLFDAGLIDEDGNTIEGTITWSDDAEKRVTEIVLFGAGISLTGELDLSGCTALKQVICADNKVTSLNVSGCTALETLSCGYSAVASIDVSGCTALKLLYCEVANLTSLDVSGCSALETLQCGWNSLTTLDLSANTRLNYISCSYNNLTSLDVSANTALTELRCFNNQLTFDSLVLPEGYSGSLSADQTVDLGETISRVDFDGLAAYVNDETTWTWYDTSGDEIDTDLITEIDGVFTFDMSLAGKGVYCVMTNTAVSGMTIRTGMTQIDLSGVTFNAHDFQKLFDAGLIDEDGNTIEGTITWSDDAEKRVTSIDVFGQNLSGTLDLSGCEALESLVCFDNQLTSLDISGCTALTRLYCDENQLTSLDVSDCTALTDLYCSYNLLTSLDVSANSALTDLRCDDNQLTSLDVSANTALTNLWCDDNLLTSLDVSANTALTNLWCINNQLTSLDVSDCTALTDLYCYGNLLTSLDVSGCTALTYLYCYGNLLTSLDVSGCTALRYLECYGNLLSSLDISDCTNLNWLSCVGNRFTFATLPAFSGNYFYSGQEAIDMDWQISLTDFSGLASQFGAGGGTTTYTWCDSKGAVLSDYTEIDGVFTFGAALNGESIYCVLTNTAYPDLTLETELAMVSDGSIAVNQYEKNLVDLQGLTQYSQWEKIDGVARLVGINAVHVDLSHKVIDLSGCTELRTVYLLGNDLTSLDLEGCTKLQTVSCFNNELTSLTLLGCDSLKTLHCYNNKLESLALNDCTELKVLNCSNNELTDLNLGNCAALEDLKCDENALTTLDLSANTALTSLTCGYNQLSQLDLSNQDGLSYLECSNNRLEFLTVSDVAKFVYFSCGANLLTSLDLSGQDELTVLYTCDNMLTSLDVSGCENLTVLYTCDNMLTSLDVSNCTSLNVLLCCNNELTGLDLTGLVNLSSLNCSNNRMTFSSLDAMRATLSVSEWFFLVYTDQKPMDLGDTISGGTADLSSEYSVDGNTTAYTWYYEDGTTVDTDLVTGSGGVFQFDDALNGSRIYGEMTNAAFPELILKTVVFDVAVTTLDTPLNLRLIAAAQTTLSIDWNDAEGASQYVLQRKGPGDTGFKTIYTGAESKYVDRDLTAGTEYEYRVQAVGSGFSDVLSVSTEPAQVSGAKQVDSPMILDAEYDAENNRNTVAWTDLGDDYVYTVYKSGRVVVDGGSDAFYVDPNPTASGTDGYTILAYHTKMKQYSTIVTAVLHSTAPAVEITGVDFLDNGTVKLLWDVQPGMYFTIMQAGRTISGDKYIESGEWIDENPDDSKEYLLVTFYPDSGGGSLVTFSNLFSAKRPAQSAMVAYDAFWSEYGVNEEGLFADLMT